MTGTDLLVDELASTVLPEGCGWRRDPLLKPEAHGPDHDARYDFDTLFYGAAYRPDRKALVLVGPPPLNLKPLMRAGRYLADGTPLRLRRIKVYRRHCEVWLTAGEAPAELRFAHDGLDLTVPILRPLPGFAGRRCLVTLSKDNDLDWVRDWAGHCARHQGVEALLFLDNASTKVDPKETAAVLAEIPGLAVAVISVPARFGPVGIRSPASRALFLQTGMLNICRHAWLREARSVMHCDIDELPVSDGPTLFEAAEKSRLGYATARCLWRLAGDLGGHKPRHGDHVLRFDPGTTTKEKWVVCPRGPLGDTVWATHGVAGYLFNPLSMARGSRFYHCDSVTTHWKRKGGTVPEGVLVEDDRTRKDYRRLGLVAGRPVDSDTASEAMMQPVNR
ncbi:hypothetical protein [Frigidibacter sp. ROC022]|uniref:hypothetical protein n=1 Tax=Frigidibacter sp. ROC022 TaxID=2971796 RepID=UPI00215B48DD|nr:hypothetical protein [Frigidibacter sp. ROC022]MCR8726801.1 hypothetical protein [Frigidibacter sp. ROC022]